MTRSRNILTIKLQRIKIGARRLQNTKFYALLIAITVLAGTLFLSPAIYSFTNSVIIKSSGRISTTEVWANSGSPTDIQAAVDAVASAGGGTVYVPEGNFTFNFSGDNGVTILGGVNVIGMGRDKTVLERTTGTGGDMFYIDGSNGKSVRISGIHFKGYVDLSNEYGCSGIKVYNTKDFRIDNNTFTNFPDSSVMSSKGTGVHRGVIDHNIFDNPYKEEAAGPWDWGYGVNLQMSGAGRASFGYPELTYFLGNYDDNIVFIEDNVFSRCRYAGAGNTGAWYVLRYNDITISPLYNSWAKAGTDVHEGVEGSYPGGRGLEAYNNIIRRGGGYSDQGFKMRSGSGVIVNNTLIDVDRGVWLINSYQSNPQNYVHELYIWGNTYQNVGDQLSKDAFYQENIHYFLRAPTQEQDGFTYTPYAYPHPLTT